MTVKNSTQKANRWKYNENPTELSTEIYPKAIVEDFIFNRVKRNLLRIEGKNLVESDLNNVDLEFNDAAGLGIVRESYGFRNASYYSKKTQRWIGHILSIEGDRFFSRLDDLTNPGTYETAELDISDISPEDVKLVEIGAIFYWSIGVTMDNGQLKKESTIRFKRTSQWTAKDIDSIEDRAEKILKSIPWD